MQFLTFAVVLSVALFPTFIESMRAGGGGHEGGSSHGGDPYGPRNPRTEWHGPSEHEQAILLNQRDRHLEETYPGVVEIINTDGSHFEAYALNPFIVFAIGEHLKGGYKLFAKDHEHAEPVQKYATNPKKFRNGAVVLLEMMAPLSMAVTKKRPFGPFDPNGYRLAKDEAERRLLLKFPKPPPINH